MSVFKHTDCFGRASLTAIGEVSTRVPDIIAAAKPFGGDPHSYKFQRNSEFTAHPRLGAKRAIASAFNREVSAPAKSLATPDFQTTESVSVTKLH